MEQINYSAYCPLCDKTVHFELNDEQLASKATGEFAIITIGKHGIPEHNLKVYIDKNHNIRGTYPEFVNNNIITSVNNLKFNHLVDGSADITYEEGKQAGLEVIPFEVIIQGKIRRKYPTEITQNEIMKFLITHQKVECEAVSVEEYLSAFRRNNNLKPIIVNTISSYVSKNYKNALKAKNTLEKVNLELANNIIVFDSNGLSPILKTMSMKATELDNKGCQLNEILSYQEWLRRSHRTYFIAEDLECLKRNNLLGTITSVAENIKGTKPILIMNNDGQGKLEVFKSIKSQKEGLAEFARLIKQDFKGREVAGIIFHAMSEIAAVNLREYLEIMLKVKKDNFRIEPVGSTLCVHGGFGLLGVSVYPLEN